MQHVEVVSGQRSVVASIPHPAPPHPATHSPTPTPTQALISAGYPYPYPYPYPNQALISAGQATLAAGEQLGKEAVAAGGPVLDQLTAQARRGRDGDIGQQNLRQQKEIGQQLAIVLWPPESRRSGSRRS